MSTGTAVSTVVRGQQAVMRLNSTHLDYDMLNKYAEALRGSARMPGTPLGYSKGKYYTGFGKDKKQLKHPVEVVANIPNLMFAWRKFTDAGMEMPHFCYPLIGESLPARSEMGDLDKDLWEDRTDPKGKVVKDDDGNPLKDDPWQQVAILMLRKEKTGELLRFETASLSGKGAVVKLVQDYAAEAKRNPDKLPVIVMDSTEVPIKGAKRGETYDAPTFEIVDWVDATTEDFPEGGVSLAAETEEVKDAGKGKAQSRGSKKAAVVEEEEDEAPRRGRGRAARNEEPEEEEEAPRRGRRAAVVEEEEEEEPAPRRGRRAAVVEEEEEEEPAPRRGRRAAAAVEDDEEDEPAPARARRRVMAA